MSTPPVPPAVPDRMRRLPRDRHGRVVPWFVAVIDGVPDFRLVRPGGVTEAVRYARCWVCGTHLGRHVTYVIGPMCAVNRISAEPPSHRECAEYSARGCPFLSVPSMTRRPRGIAEAIEGIPQPGVIIPRNPGVALLWATLGPARPFTAPGGVLFDIGEPTGVGWYAHGRAATRAEVLASISTGLPLLEAEAAAEGPAAVADLAAMAERAMTLVPA